MDGTAEITAAELARLWREAPALLPHGAGCGCGGHPSFHLDPAAVEADILDYLANRYAADERLTGAIAARRADATLSFAAWLAGIDEIVPDRDARARLKQDLAVTLASLS